MMHMYVNSLMSKVSILIRVSKILSISIALTLTFHLMRFNFKYLNLKTV